MTVGNMLVRNSMSGRLKTAVVMPLLAVLLISYFAFYTFFGERSLLRLMRLEAKLQTTQAKLDSVKSEREAMQARVDRMKPEHLDADLLDEQSRRVLNYTAPGELVVYDKSEKLDR